MNKRDYILLGIAVIMSFSPAMGTSLIWFSGAGALLAVGALAYCMIRHSKEEEAIKARIKEVEAEVKKSNDERDQALAKADGLDKFFAENGYGELMAIREKIENERIEFTNEMERQCAEYEKGLAEANAQQEQVLQEKTALVMKLEKQVADLDARKTRALELAERADDAAKKYESLQNKIAKAKKNLETIEYSLENWLQVDNKPVPVLLAEDAIAEQNALDPISESNLHAMTMPDLKKESRAVAQQIDRLCDEFSQKFQQKALRSLFATVVLYLKLEIRSILEELRYKEQDEAIKKVRHLMFRVQDMLEDGNKTIKPTIVAFLGEMEKLGIDAVKVEYVWYLRKEQQKQEQAALRERMKEEREERQRMEEERKRVAEEERKYAAEMERLRQKLEEEKARVAAMTDAAVAAGEEPPKSIASEAQKEIEAQMLKVESCLGEVAVQKEEIAKLQNGKAGTVYVISNLGSFGDNVFKVGMTRRLNPQDRVDELGDASVPFEFDVHSFIFSEDAASLETELHRRLSEMRVNKINPRKEFFRLSLDEIERIVQETDPTAEFNRTMIAEEYRASMNGIVLDNLEGDHGGGELTESKEVEE